MRKTILALIFPTRTARPSSQNAPKRFLAHAVGALLSIVSCGAAMAQGAPPPAVSVRPVQSRQITATGDFVGRVSAINKVDIVARVAGFIQELRSATRLEPDLAQAHYRLSQAYQRTGQKALAAKELEIFERLSARTSRNNYPTLSNPSVISMYVPHGSVMKAMAIPSAGTFL